jgi:chromosome segregation ATPase
MARMNRLFGVTMAERGCRSSSRSISRKRNASRAV